MNNLNVLLRNSPKFKTKIRSNKGIKIIVIHYTGMQSEVDALNRLTDFKSKVSCHYLINEKGQIISIIIHQYICPSLMIKFIFQSIINIIKI